MENGENLYNILSYNTIGMSTCYVESSKNVLSWGIGLGCNNYNKYWRPLEILHNEISNTCIDISSILQKNTPIFIDNTYMGKIGNSYTTGAYNNAPYTLLSNVSFIKNTDIISNTNISNGLFNIVYQSNPITISGLTISGISLNKPLITISNGADVTINNLNVNNCQCLQSLIDIRNSSLTLQNITINNVISNSGAIFNFDKSTLLHLQSCNISGCNTYKGVIFSNSNISLNNSTCNFYNNYSMTNGGAIFTNNYLTISGNKTNLMFNNNSASGSGGTIIANSGCTVNDASITFKNNYSDYDGGAINAYGGLTIIGNHTNLKFYDNSARRGGAIITAKNIIVKDTSSGTIYFSGNKAQSGGAIHCNKELYSITLDNTLIEFSGNISTGLSPLHQYIDGGAIYANTISIVDSSIIFNNNFATSNGGAIYASEDISIVDSSINFINNYADACGGVIITKGSLDICGGILDFYSNKAKFGGALYINNSLIMNDSSISFINNHATISGGAIYMYNLSSDLFKYSCKGTYVFSKNTVLDLWSAVGPYSCLYTTKKNFLCVFWGGPFFINCN